MKRRVVMIFAILTVSMAITTMAYAASFSRSFAGYGASSYTSEVRKDDGLHSDARATVTSYNGSIPSGFVQVYCGNGAATPKLTFGVGSTVYLHYYSAYGFQYDMNKLRVYSNSLETQSSNTASGTWYP